MKLDNRASRQHEEQPVELSEVEGTEPSSRGGSRGRVLGKALTSESFVEKLALLLLTAVLSGIIVPYIVKSIESTRERNEAILQAQSRLLDEVSETILTAETLALDVSWACSRRSAALKRKSAIALMMSNT